MRVWITRYALSKGIFELEAKDCGNGMISGEQEGFPVYYHGQGCDWCKTDEEAIAIAEEMRKKKIASLEKQIKKLEKMKFN